jgi:hypothetical protein
MLCNSLDAFHAIEETVEVAVDIDGDYNEDGSVLVGRSKVCRQAHARECQSSDKHRFHGFPPFVILF